MKSIGVIYTTVSNEAQADALATQVLKIQLAACINMIPKVASMYIWNDKIKKSEEMIMIFKTSIDKLEALQDWLEAHHPYDVPVIIKSSGTINDAFFDYVQSTVNLSTQFK